MATKIAGYQIPDFEVFTDGSEPPPNFQSMKLSDGVRMITGRITLEALPYVRRVMMPGGGVKHARYFLDHTQGGLMDGSGVCIWYDETSGKGYAGAFTICEHVKVAGSGANPQRGWHPGACKNCGLDMTVDSSG